jgi:hypothetical protein
VRRAVVIGDAFVQLRAAPVLVKPLAIGVEGERVQQCRRNEHPHASAHWFSVVRPRE